MDYQFRLYCRIFIWKGMGTAYQHVLLQPKTSISLENGWGSILVACLGQEMWRSVFRLLGLRWHSILPEGISSWRSQKSFKMKKKAYRTKESQALWHSNRKMFWSEVTCSVTYKKHQQLCSVIISAQKITSDRHTRRQLPVFLVSTANRH